MLKYTIRRIIIMIPLLLVVAALIFTIMCFVPSDPITISMADTQATQAEIEAARESMGYNDPYPLRLLNYMKDVVFHLDFGTSYKSGKAVVSELTERFPNTLILAVGSILVSIIIGIPVGVMSAVKAERLVDRISMFLTLLFNSMPNFWLALLLVLLFSVKLKWLPSNGNKDLTYFILPVLANSLGGVAGIARQTRASMLEVIRSDFVTTARSKGLSERTVIYGHAFPNALIPIITVCGSRFGMLLGGTTIIEMIFSIPGIGAYMINGINNRDYNVVQGSMVYLAAVFMLIMLLTDLIYALVDPRIRAKYASKRTKKGAN